MSNNLSGSLFPRLLSWALFFLVIFSHSLSSAQTYCSPSYANGCPFSNLITNVSVGTLNHSPANCTAHDFTALSTLVAAGVTTPIDVTSSGYCSVGVAIDLNSDGDFDDAGEIMALPTYIGAFIAVYNLTITIPAATPNGSYRMRVYNRLANSGNGTPTDSPCGAYGYGSWVDYTVIVYHQCASISSVTASPPLICGSGTTALNVVYTSSIPGIVKWYNAQGIQVGTGTPYTTPTLTSSAVFYASVDNGTCDTPRVPVTVTVVPPVATPLSVTPADTTICEGKTVKITAVKATQTDSVIAANGTLTLSKMPINGSGVNSATELIYTASELNASGKITNIGFYKKNANTTFNPGAVTIYMKNTTSNMVTGTASTAGYTLVYTGAWPNVGVVANSWNNITLNNPFPYTGGSNNLAILIVRTAGSSSLGNAPTYRASSTGTVNRSSYYIAGAWSSGVSPMTVDTIRPDINIKYQVEPAINWTPVTALFKDAALTQPMALTDTNTTVYAHPAATTTYDVYSNRNGCLSSGFLSAVIYIIDTVHVSVSDSVCAGQSYNFSSQVLTTSGTYTATFQSASFCDSVVTLNLTVKPYVTNAVTVNICQGQTYTFNGITYTTAQTGLKDTFSTAGCDSIVTLNLTVDVNVVPAFTITSTICNGAVAPALPGTSTNGITGTWTPATVSNTTTGTYTFTPTAGLCATTATVTVTVNPVITPAFTITPTICNGAVAPVLPGTSTNGITGTWAPATVSNTATGTYTFTPTAGQCATTATVTVTVNPNVLPAFTITPAICNGAVAPVLPATSTNGITGTWTPATVSNTTTGTYTFTPTAGQCATTAAVTVTVNPNVLPVFTITPAICDGAVAPVLPGTSANGITGTWAPATVSNTTTGTYTFTPTAGQCATTATVTVTVNPNVLPTFTITPAICNGAVAPVLLGTSTNGITGTWAPATVSNTTTGTYTFTPTAGQCATTATVTVTVNPNVVPAFTITTAICNGAVAPVLPGTSTNGITGTWTPATVSNTTTGTYTFTPTAGQCATTATVTVTVNPNVLPVFTITPAICNGAAAPVLPGTSTNGITGTWAPATVSNTTTGTYTFTPTAGQCATTATVTVTVNPVLTPTFTITPSICNSAAAPALPGTSTNGITGTWAPATVSNTTTGTYTFTPTAGQCATTATVTVTVNPIVTPTFTITPAICNGAAAPVLPGTSTNGITGTWAPATVSNTATGTYTFTPAAGQCATNTTVMVTVNPNVVPAFTITPVICNGAAAPVLPGTSTNGITGTWTPATVSNTVTGTYTFTPTAGQCATTAAVTVTVNPVITPAFNTIPAICSGAAAPVLPGTSTNGITGTWAPATVSNTVTGTYTFTPAAGQCAVTATLTVIVKNKVNHTDSKTICASQLPYTWNGIPNAVNGAVYTGLAANGCDSIVTLNLTVNPYINSSQNISICQGQNYTFNNITYTTSQTGLKDTFSTAGCDSIVTLNLNVLPGGTLINKDTAACGAVWYLGTRYTQSTVLKDTLKNTLGCDSIFIVTQVTVYPNTPSLLVIDTIGCGRVLFEGTTYNSSTTLEDTLHSIHGCDSIRRIVNIVVDDFELNLTADPADPYKGEPVHLSTSSNAASYTVSAWSPAAWFPDQEKKDYYLTADEDGIIIVTGASSNGCTDTARVMLKVKPLDYGVFMPNAFSPNGDGTNDNFGPRFYMQRAYVVRNFRIFNRWGQLIYSAANTLNGSWDGRLNNGSPADIGTYGYFIEFSFIDGKTVKMKGDVALIR